jgi:hypothetical protein
MVGLILRVRVAALLVAAGLLVSQQASRLVAAESVTFDAPRTVACRDVTTDEFLASNPQERLLEARFPVSSLIRAAENDLVQFFYRFDYPANVEVEDYLPKTTLTSEIVGNVGVERKTEDLRSLGLAVSGGFEHVTGSGTGSVNTKDSTSVRYDLLPPLEMVSASGTLNRRGGVYFKLKPSPRSSLEGGKEFVVVLRVPGDWRGGYARVHCQALGFRRSTAPPFEERAILGDDTFLLGMFRDGDEIARRAATHFADSETRLRNASLAYSNQIHKQSYPSLAHRVGALVTVVSPRIPPDWLQDVIELEPDASFRDYMDRLPDPVRTAAENFQSAKQELASLSGR